MRGQCSEYWPSGDPNADAIAQVLPPSVKPAHLYRSLSNESERKSSNLNISLNKASMPHPLTIHMNEPLQLASTFSHHAYDFGDPVYIEPIQQGGVVDGIWQQSQGFVYHVSGLSYPAEAWWPEVQLQAACPACLKPWQRDHAHACIHCGYVQPFD